MTFDLKAHLAQIREGRAELVRRREERKDYLDSLEAQMVAAQEDIASIDRQLAEIDELDLDRVLGPAPVRMSGVLQLVEEVVTDLLAQVAVIDGSVCEDEIFKAVRERESLTKESSIRSSLARLVDKGKLARAGKRGSRTYSRPTAESGPPPQPPGEDVREVVLKALREADAKGVTRKDLAWVTGDAAALDAVLAEPEVEAFQREGSAETLYRIKDGSIGQRSLFQSAAPPPAHANKD